MWSLKQGCKKRLKLQKKKYSCVFLISYASLQYYLQSHYTLRILAFGLVIWEKSSVFLCGEHPVHFVIQMQLFHGQLFLCLAVLQQHRTILELASYTSFIYSLLFYTRYYLFIPIFSIVFVSHSTQLPLSLNRSASLQQPHHEG